MAPIGEAFLRDLCLASLAATGLILVIFACRRWAPENLGSWRMALWTILVLEALSVEELRHVFLHELVHLRRWDLPASWACALLQVVHWFNPMVWLAFRRMRTDRELACDQVALRSLPPAERADYGRTLIKPRETRQPLGTPFANWEVIPTFSWNGSPETTAFEG